MAAPQADTGARTWRRRLGWLVVFWVAGVATMAAVALALKMVMRMVGLST